MKSPVSIPFCAWKIRAVVSGIVFSTSVAVVFLATPTLSRAHDSQSPSANNAKTSKKVKAVQAAKPANSAHKSTDNQATALPPQATHFARKQSAETSTEARDEAIAKFPKFETPEIGAHQAYANRAYPASYIPHKLTIKAREGWEQFKAADARIAKPLAARQWTLVPLYSAEFPQILTFSGVPYFDSGRITALAISPTCQPNNCRLWTAAAGGGVWRTDDALAGNSVQWTFISSSFATNAIGT